MILFMQFKERYQNKQLQGRGRRVTAYRYNKISDNYYNGEKRFLSLSSLEV